MKGRKHLYLKANFSRIKNKERDRGTGWERLPWGGGLLPVSDVRTASGDRGRSERRGAQQEGGEQLTP